MLNFFKPIKSSTTKAAAACAPQNSRNTSLPNKRAKVSQGVIDLASDDNTQGFENEAFQHNGSAAAGGDTGAPAILRHSLSPTVHGSNGADRHQDEPHRMLTAEPGVISGSHMHIAATQVSLDAPQQFAHKQTSSNGTQALAPPVRRFKGPYMPDTESIAFLTNMGFANDQAVRALKVTQGNIERAANWLLSVL